MSSPGWVPALMVTPFTPSSVSSSNSVPRAAVVIGMVIHVCRSSPRRSNTGCFFSWIARYRSPRGPPPTPTSDSPETRTCMPSLAPAGMFTVIVLCVGTRPCPAQLWHGEEMTSP